MDLCPVWVGYLLASPLRRLFQNPDAILGPYVRPGTTVLEIGPAMGFFSLPMARMVGESGRIVCVDLQKPMLGRLDQRASKAGLSARLETRTCTVGSLEIADLAGVVDFLLAFAVVHEVPDQKGLFIQMAAAAKPGATLLLAEPRFHVGADAFAATLKAATSVGFRVDHRPPIPGSLSAALIRV